MKQTKPNNTGVPIYSGRPWQSLVTLLLAPPSIIPFLLLARRPLKKGGQFDFHIYNSHNFTGMVNMRFAELKR